MRYLIGSIKGCFKFIKEAQCIDYLEDILDAYYAWNVDTRKLSLGFSLTLFGSIIS